MNFLELCQMTVRQSGTIQGVRPTTVVGQTDRLRLIVEFVSEAYARYPERAPHVALDAERIHRARRSIGDQRYLGTDFTDERAGNPDHPVFAMGLQGRRLRHWPVDVSHGERAPTRRGRCAGLERTLSMTTQLRGPSTPGKPQFYSLTNDNQLIISPVPDAVYTIRGKYRKVGADSGRRRRRAGNAGRVPHHHQGRGAVLPRGL